MRLHYLKLFLQIVEQGSLAGAARLTGLSSTTVSEHLATLETYYGARLFNRTTRALHLTEAGRMLVEGAPRLLAEAEELHSLIRLNTEGLAGPLRISAPVDLGRQRIAPILNSFLSDHPKVTAELLLADGYVDVMADSIDVAVRYGALPDSSLRVRRIGDNRRVLCASPAYLQRHGTPKTPEELTSHNCLRMRFGARLDREWRFQDDGREFSVVVSGDRIANDGGLVRRWCLDGCGIALKSKWDVAENLEAGQLVELLAEYAPPPNALQLVLPPGRHHPRRVEEFVKVLKAGLC